ncbi:MAG: hypothetical protein GYA55_02640 [SAR324 cluster bacterium]|uniref:Lipid A biosynthesis acyltransferase n=1 Tax=SAR324 cluster bacterium TaxID=2024889 RepID=A0A7X9FPR1_9DELT|nr:hypothetical protein [SAR324 cluster bacterium]
MLDYLAYIGLRIFLWSLNIFPLKVRHKLVNALVRGVIFILPRYKQIALRNIELVFPNMSDDERESIFNASLEAISRFIVDLARLHTIDLKWAKEHVRVSLEPYEYLNRKFPGKGILIVTGHLGSFELMARVGALYDHPMSFVAREFKAKKIDDWWRGIRELNGNKVIPRTGAFKQVVSELEAGRDVGLLFDQNVKRNHAVFVPFFGRFAATTKSVALAALRNKSPVMVASMAHIENDNYQIYLEACDFTELYNDDSRSMDDKIIDITRDLTHKFEKMVLKHPAEWFWMHRRWKTTPQGVPEDFYG